MFDIVLICDDNYALPTRVCIKSIIENLQSEDKRDLKIHICTPGLTNENISEFCKLSVGNCRVDVCVFNEFLQKKTLRKIQKSHVTPSALIKFEIPNYFINLDKVLYLDSDVIVKSDIRELFCYDIKNEYLAASFEFYRYLNEKQFKFEFERDYSFYFNSGVMLFNLKKMREDSITDKLWDYKLHNTKTTLMDQECFNEICGRLTAHLPICWNFNPVFYSQDYIDDINLVYDTKYLSIDELRKDVKIIHYVGKTDKPWIYSTAKFEQYWMKYYQLLYGNRVLDRVEYFVPKRCLFVKVYDKIREHGWKGFIHFCVYKFKQKWKK